MGFDCIRDCPEIGACCRNLCLKISPKGLLKRGKHGFRSRRDCERWLIRKGLPMFYVISEEPNGVFRFACNRLRPNGLCGDYEHRPDICRNYQPGQDGLCRLHGQKPPSFSCADCPEPGACCKNIRLKVYPIGILGKPTPQRQGFNSWNECEAWLKQKGYDMFHVVSEDPTGIFRFRCDYLEPNGRCKVEKNKPELCRNYDPGSTPLCRLFTKSQ